MTTTKNEQRKLVMPYGLMYGRDITDAQKVTAMWIVNYAAKGTTDTCSASNRTLSICAGKSERQIRRDISALCKQGYLQVAPCPPQKNRGRTMFDSARYLKLDPKIFKMPVALEEKLIEDEILQAKEAAVDDPEMSGPPDMDVHLYKNKNNNYTLNMKTIAGPSAPADTDVYGLVIGLNGGWRPRPASRLQLAGPPVIPTMSFDLGRRATCGSRAGGAAAQILSQVKNLRLPPRIEGMICRLISAGHLPEDIVIHDNIVITRKELPMNDKKTMPQHLSLHELLERSNQGQLLRKPTRQTGALVVTQLSQTLRTLCAPIKFTPPHTTRQLAQLKQFMRVVQAAGEDPEKVLSIVAGDWGGFGAYLTLQGKGKPRDITPEPGALAYHAGECVNFARQEMARGTRRVATPPAGVDPAQGTQPRQAAGAGGIMTSQSFLDAIKASEEKGGDQ